MVYCLYMNKKPKKVTFICDDEVYLQFQTILLRERSNVSRFLNDAIRRRIEKELKRLDK